MLSYFFPPESQTVQNNQPSALIKEIDQFIDDEQFMIINDPKKLTNPLYLNRAQKYLGPIVKWESTQAMKVPTTTALMHLNPKNRKPMSSQEISKFYENYAKKIKNTENKPVTCDGLSIVAFNKAKHEIQQKNLSEKITVDLCGLRNWAHTLLLFTYQDDQDENNIIQVFYDPWYQRICSNSPHSPCIIEPESLSTHMDSVKSHAGRWVGHTNVLYKNNDNKFVEVPNKDTDYAYYKMCSTNQDFNYIMKPIDDPSQQTSIFSNCTIL